MFKLQITFDRHNARQKLNYCLLPDPPLFSLPSTFNIWDRGLAKSFLGIDKSKFVIVIVIDYNNRILHNITRTRSESTKLLNY
jgi:hypothetical protein